MPTITKKQLEDYEQLCHDRNNGRLLPRTDCGSSVKHITLTQRKSDSISWRSCRGYVRRKNIDGGYDNE